MPTRPTVIPAARDNADAVLGDLGLLLIPGTKRRYDLTNFSPSVRTSDPRYQDFSLQQSLVISSAHHGRGQLEFSDPDAFFDSSSVDTRIREQVILAALQNLTTKAASASIAGNPVKFYLSSTSANLFLITGGSSRDILQWTNGSTVWTSETTPGLTVDPTDIIDFLGDIWVAQGESADARRKNAGTWAGAGFPAVFFESVGNVLYWSDNVNELYFATAAPQTAANRRGPIYVGDTNTQIRAIKAWDTRVYIGKDDGLYVLQEGRVSKLVDFSSARDPNNFKWMKIWNGALYFPILNGLYRLVGGTTLQAVGPDRGAAGAVEVGQIRAFETLHPTYKSLATGKTGQIVDLIPTENFLYAVTDGLTTGQSQILAYNGSGWHQVVEGRAPAGQFTAANSEYLSIADNAALSMGDIDFTIAAWVYADSLGGAGVYRAFVSKYNLVPNLEYFLYFDGDQNRFRFTLSNDGTNTTGLSASSLGAPSTGTWYLVVAWHDSVGNTMNIQVNGGSVDSLAYSSGVLDSTSEFRLGSRSDSTNFWNGRIGPVGIWKRVLTADERSELYNAGIGPLLYSQLPEPLRLSATAYWNLTEVSGSRADSAGSNTLTDNNTVTQWASRIQAAGFTASLATSGQLLNPRLWYGYGNDAYNVILPFGTEDPFEYTSETYEAAGRWKSSWYTAFLTDVPKEWQSLTLESENLSTTETIQVAYELDDMGYFQNLVNPDSSDAAYAFTFSPQQAILFPRHTVSKRIRLRLTLIRGSTNTETPKFKRAILKFMPRPNTKWGWQLAVRSGRNLRNEYLNQDEDVDPTEMLQLLERIRSSKSRLDFDDGDLEPGITNLILNPEFRLDTAGDGLADNWNLVGTPTATLNTANKIIGLRSQQLVTLATGTEGAESDTITTVTGTRYTVSVWAQLTSGDAITLVARNQAGSADIASYRYASTGTAWVRLEVTFAATSTSTRLRVIRATADATAATTFRICAAQIEITPDDRNHYRQKASSFCSGDQPRCRWTGRPHASTSIRDATVPVFVSTVGSVEIERPAVQDRERGIGNEFRTSLSLVESG